MPKSLELSTLLWLLLASIVISMSVCMCVCVCLSVCPQAYLPNHTRDLYQFFVHVAYGRGLVLLRRGDETPRKRGNFGGFLPKWQCIVQHNSWDPYKNGWPNRDAVWVDEIVQSPITSCNGKDQSASQASANSIRKIAGQRRRGLLAAKRVVGLHCAAKSDLCDCPIFHL